MISTEAISSPNQILCAATDSDNTTGLYIKCIFIYLYLYSLYYHRK